MHDVVFGIFRGYILHVRIYVKKNSTSCLRRRHLYFKIKQHNPPTYKSPLKYFMTHSSYLRIFSEDINYKKQYPYIVSSIPSTIQTSHYNIHNRYLVHAYTTIYYVETRLCVFPRE